MSQTLGPTIEGGYLLFTQRSCFQVGKIAWIKEGGTGAVLFGFVFFATYTGSNGFRPNLPAGRRVHQVTGELITYRSLRPMELKIAGERYFFTKPSLHYHSGNKRFGPHVSSDPIQGDALEVYPSGTNDHHSVRFIP